MVGEIFDSPTFSLRDAGSDHPAGGPSAGLAATNSASTVSLARTAGLTEQQIDAILGTGDLDAAGFSRTERTVIDPVTELCTTHRLTDDSFAAGHSRCSATRRSPNC